MFDAASTLDDILQNLKFLQRNKLLDRLGRTANLLYHDHVAFKGTPGYQTALQRKMLLPQGLFGFEGLLLYQDFRVGWLAGLMKRDLPFPPEGNGKTFITCLLGGRVCTKRDLSGSKRSTRGDLRKAARFCGKAQLSAGCKLDGGIVFRADG